MLEDLNGPDGDTDGDDELDVNEVWVYTGTYTITEEDMNKESITNTAEAKSSRTDPVRDSVTIDRTEIEIIPEPEEVPLGEPEIIEEPEVPQALPDTGAFFNTTIIAVLGLLLLALGIFINKAGFIKG
jgi:hypothetical protein